MHQVGGRMNNFNMASIVEPRRALLRNYSVSYKSTFNDSSDIISKTCF